MGREPARISSDSTVEAIRSVLWAESVAVVGASATPGKLGFMTTRSLIQGGYKGRIYPVNSKGGRVFDLPAYCSVSEIPDRLDAVVIVIPAAFVADVLEQSAAKGAKGAIVQAAGFREAGRGDLEDRIKEVSRRTGIRVFGPNIQGLAYLPNKLQAVFFPVIRLAGPLAVISQSGSVTAALSEWAERDGLGLCAAINLGNQSDLTAADYLDAISEDQHAGVIALYLEGVTQGDRLMESLASLTPKKPVVVLKGGRGRAGSRSAASHTGSLAGDHRVFSAACRQCGAVVARDLEDLYDKVKALAHMPPPYGNRVAIISTSGGAGTLASDEAEALGLVVDAMPEALVEELKPGVLPLANLENPLDLADIRGATFVEAAQMVEKHQAADVILISFGDPVSDGVEAVREIQRTVKLPLAVSYMGGGKVEMTSSPEIQQMGVPVFRSPERAMRGISALVRRAALSILRESEAHRDLWPGPGKPTGLFLTEPEGIELLKEYGLTYPDHVLVHSAEDAVQAASRLGYPVVLKAVSPVLIHKSDAGGVVVNLSDARSVAEAYGRIIRCIQRSIPRAAVSGMLVCKQEEPGLEIIVGALRDAAFGPTVMCGLGGVFTETIKDVSFRIAPFEHEEAAGMIKELQGYPLFTGNRGSPPVDISSLTRLLVTVGELVIKRRDIVELDLNPVRVYPKGLSILDVRIRMDQAP